MKKRYIIVILTLTLATNMVAQDFIFSQFFASQPYFNPAMTGFFDGSYRINAHMRNQWLGINGGNNTFGFNGDMKFGDNDPEKDYFAMGVCAYHDMLFDRMSYTTSRLNMSFTKRLGYGDYSHFLSLGANIGMDLKSINTNNLIWVQPGNPETPQKPNIFLPNAGVGINWQTIFPKFANVFFGVAADHLVTDRNSVLNTNNKVDTRFNIYTSARLRVTDKVYVLPAALRVMQGAAGQTNFGVSAQMLMRNYYTDKTNVQIGVFSRLANTTYDAVIISGRYENKGMMLGLSYDHNLSNLNQATGGYGALEVTIGYIGLIQRAIKSRAECPDMKNF